MLSLTVSHFSSPCSLVSAAIYADAYEPKHQPFPCVFPGFGLFNLLVLSAFLFKPSCNAPRPNLRVWATSQKSAALPVSLGRSNRVNRSQSCFFQRWVQLWDAKKEFGDLGRSGQSQGVLLANKIFKSYPCLVHFFQWKSSILIKVHLEKPKWTEAESPQVTITIDLTIILKQ